MNQKKIKQKGLNFSVLLLTQMKFVDPNAEF